MLINIFSRRVSCRLRMILLPSWREKCDSITGAVIFQVDNFKKTGQLWGSGFRWMFWTVGLISGFFFLQSEVPAFCSCRFEEDFGSIVPNSWIFSLYAYILVYIPPCSSIKRIIKYLDLSVNNLLNAYLLCVASHNQLLFHKTSSVM